MKNVEKYKFFIEKLREVFDEKYPTLKMDGVDYKYYVFNFIETAIKSALENDL